MVIISNFEIREMREKHSLESYYFRSFICLQIGTNFQCRFKKIVGMWENILFKKFSCGCYSGCQRRLSLWGQLVSPVARTLAAHVQGLKEWPFVWVQNGPHHHCPEDILALFPCLVWYKQREESQEPMGCFPLLAVTDCSENSVSPLTRPGIFFSAGTQDTPHLLLTFSPQIGLILELRADGWQSLLLIVPSSSASLTLSSGKSVQWPALNWTQESLVYL